MPEIPILAHDAVLAAVSPGLAIERVRQALKRFYRGEWAMPPKVYLSSAPFGDFRAMPARGDGLVLLKWVTSFPGNPARGLPTVTGIVCLSDATTGEPLMLLDARSVTALRTGAVAAVASAALAPSDARSVGMIGCGLCTARGARAVWRPRGTARASATTLTPRRRRHSPPSSAGQSVRVRKRCASRSSAA